MKDLLSKEHYCYKIHTLLMKSIPYPPSSSRDNNLPMCTTPPPPVCSKYMTPKNIEVVQLRHTGGLIIV